MEKENNINKSDKINSIAFTRGFFFNTANIYGGKAGFFTYGHLGKLLKNKWENLWRKYFLNLNNNFYEIQSNNILPESVFIASGHVKSFNDPLVECKKCNLRYRADHLLEEIGIKDTEALSLDEINKQIQKNKIKCAKCKKELSDAMQFNMMFPLNIGIGKNSKAYLSPETAQAAYLAFKDEFYATREKLPLGLAIIDKAYRNEISPRQGFFRLREFTQAELQIFFDVNEINKCDNWNKIKKEKLLIKFSGKNKIQELEAEKLNKDKKIPKFYLYYLLKVQNFYLKILNYPKEKFRLRELNEKEKAFYNKIHFDVEVYFNSLNGFKEIAGVHYRTDHDLEGHSKLSKKNLSVTYNNRKTIPHVLELSFGADRNVFSLLDVFYNTGKDGGKFSFPSLVSPYSCAVFPLVKNNEKIKELSLEIYKNLKKKFNVFYDESGSIGRRYARNDEIGTPFCITIDEKSLENNTITIRERDSMKQVRVNINELENIIEKLVNNEINFNQIK